MASGLRCAVLGATGAVGCQLLGELLAARRSWAVVKTMGRRKADVPSSFDIDADEEEERGRLQQVVVDMETLNDVGLFRDLDVVFCALGTTRSAAGSAERFREIDYGCVERAATLAQAAGVRMFSYVSSTGASASSWFTYLKVKGEVEDMLRAKGFERVSIFRPGLLDRGAQARFKEKVASIFMPTIRARTVAQAMRVEAEQALSRPAQRLNGVASVSLDGEEEEGGQKGAEERGGEEVEEEHKQEANKGAKPVAVADDAATAEPRTAREPSSVDGPAPYEVYINPGIMALASLAPRR